MRSLLDDVLDATVARSGAVVVSEQHDVNKVHIEESAIDAGLGRVAGVWDAAEFGISRAEVQRRIAEAGTPEARERVLVDLRRRAINRAGLDTSTGRVAVAVAGEPAWHRLGVNVASAMTARDAIRLASLDWAVDKRPMSFRRADGSYVTSADTFAIVRADTDAQLGTVGNRYRAIQNADGFDFLDDVIGDHGARYHTAGAIYGGAKVWMQCELPGQSFEVVRGDRVDCYAVFSNPHDGSGRAFCYPTSNRIVCANTFRVANKDRDKGIGIRHTGDVKASIADARRALGLAVNQFSEFAEAASAMVHQPVDGPAFFSDLLDAVLDVTAAEAAKGADVLAAAIAVTTAQRELEAKRIRRQIEQRENVLEDILQRYDSERCGVGGIRGTAWSAFNAVTEHADYAKRRMVGTDAERLSRRFESVLNGDADQMKQTAYQLLTLRA